MVKRIRERALWREWLTVPRVYVWGIGVQPRAGPLFGLGVPDF